MGKDNFVMGMDFGTDSVRTIVVDARNGKEVAASVFYYPRWRDGLYCDPAASRFRQHPLDYIEGIEATVKDCLKQVGAAKIRALSVDTTGSTPVAVDMSGTPLGLIPGFEENPNALFVLWKDHSATREAAEINLLNTRFPQNYLQFVGGIYSSEWFWAKLLHVLRVDPAVRKACYSWVEHCDWVPFLLTGGNDIHRMQRSVCAAGHKALWAPAFGGLPPDEFFTALDPLLTGFTTRLFKDAYAADRPAGKISPAWATRLGLPDDMWVGVGAFDAHMGAVGGQIEPYHLSKVMGTSTCDMLVAPGLGDKLVAGICGQVEGSIIPGMMGLEAGQSAFGDTYAWWKDVLSWPLRRLPANIREALEGTMLADLTEAAGALPPALGDPLALDWLNGRRTPDADQEVKGALVGLNLSSDAPRIFKAWVEATCFGARAIVDRFHREGVPVEGLIGLGGVARKSPYIMQVMADVMDRPIRIHRSEQTCALGASMFAATVAGLYPRVEEAMGEMGPGFDKTYTPGASRVGIYAARYERYRALGQFIDEIR